MMTIMVAVNPMPVVLVIWHVIVGIVRVKAAAAALQNNAAIMSVVV